MSDFTVSVDFDARQILQGFQKLEQDARKSGEAAGKQLADGLQGFSSKSITALQQELSRLTQRQLKVDVDSKAFTVTGEKIRAVQAQLDALQRKQVAIGVNDRSIVALQSRLQELQARQVLVDVDSSEFRDLEREINRVQADLQQVERRRIAINVDDRSLQGLQAKLQTLQAKQVRVDVDSSEFRDLQAEINKTQAEIADVERKRVLINVDSNSITALNTKLQGLQNELGRVAIGSQRFRELQAAIQDTERELAKAGESTDKFRLLDGVIQGVAFSLSNAVVNAAGQALAAVGGVINGFARLDTEIRKAAAAGGEAGGYGKLSDAIDKVGIEAAGTQQQVAELTTELVRGGLTIDQTTESLAAIVRGAEATGTAYAAMGSVVSAALKGFGLDASEATRVVDALVTGANASATSVEGMGNAFKYAAPVAKILGISVEDLGIAIGLLTNAGISAEEAGVTLRNGLSKLASAAPQAAGSTQKLTGQAKMAADAMKSLGVNIYNTDGTLKPMRDTLLQLKGAFDKLGPSAKIRLAASLFGGEDDGTKWLALLNQSNEEIIKMANTMANTKGATDVARDAMQGFQLTLAQLTGTLDSLANNVGKIAAGALLPLIQVANGLVGAVAALPGPVKDTAIALGLLAGAVVGATTAYVVFHRVLQANITQQAITGTIDLARAIGSTLVGGISTAAAAWPAFIAQARLASTAQFTLIGSLKATATALKAQFIAAIDGAKAGLASLAAALRSATFAQFIAGARAAFAALAPIAAAVAAISAAVVVWQQTLSESNAAQEVFAGAQQKSADSTRKLETAIGSLGKATAQTFSVWQQLSAYLSEPMGMREVAIQTEQLQSSLTRGQTAALKFYNSIKDGSTITAKAAAEGKAYVQYLNDQAQVLSQLIPSLRAKADAAEREGKLGLAEQYRRQADALEVEAATTKALSGAIQQKVQAQGKAAGLSREELAMTEEQTKLNKERIATEAELNKLIAQAPVRRLDQQLAVGQQLLGLAQATAQVEQSRYGVTRSALEFELQQAEQRGASEQQIGAIKDQIAANDREALQARYQALIQEQQLQTSLLALSQEKARAEANLDVLQQRAALLQATAKLEEAKVKGDQFAIDAALAQVNLQREILGIKEGQVSLLAQTQPLEASAANLQAEAARNGLKAEAAAKGYTIALNGTLQPANALVGLQGQISTVTRASAEDQRRYTQLAEQSGLAIGRAKDGSLVLGRTQQDVNKAVAEMNRQIAGASGEFDRAGKSAGQTRGAVDGIGKSLSGSQQPATALAKEIERTGGLATSATGETNKLGGAIDKAAKQGARDFASYLSSAKVFAERIANLNLGRAMATVATETNRAAGAAKTFYDWLRLASDLPGSRWTGGPVEAGEAYRVNELGQEALLSAGRLSLIPAAPNSIWRAPADGLVIPAGITARLQAQGAMQPAGSSAVGTAELAIEVGKLRAEVGNLARRDWSVHVQHRTGPTGSQVMRTLLS